MNFDAIIALAGGLGMFLLGIHHLTEGLKGFAGDVMRRGLQKLVSGKWSGLISGTVFTAIIQSSSAAILTVIGFVSAGLVTHSQAVAVVLGANLGTTATSWLVAIFGFKVKISAAALPMLGIGGFLWLLGKGRIRAIGAVLAGFGLLFTGIEYLQNGMAGVEWDLSGMGSGIGGVWILAGIGVVMTIIMQSSSAAAATTLVALAGGTITLDQAFALVVGQNIGTTATAIIAVIGGGLAVRRIAIAHVLFNTITGVLALLFLQPLGNIARWMGEHLGNDTVLTLAVFHTLFNVVGIFLFFPWLDGFARLIEKLTGRNDISCVSRLGKTLSNAGGTVALEAAWRAMIELSVTSLHALKDQDKRQAEAIQDLQGDIQKVSDFIHSLHFDAADSHSLSDRRERLWHALDHMRMLSRDLAKPAKNVSNARAKESITQAQQSLDAWLNWANRATPTDGETSVAELAKASSQLAATRKDLRVEMFDQLGSGELQPADAMTDLDSLRWYDGAYYHAWRLTDSLWKAAGKGSAEGL